jgi:ribonuclease D
LLIEHASDLAPLAQRLPVAGPLALDTEANGLFAFRPRLCTLQLAWTDGDRRVVVIIDAIATGVAPLARLLGPDGPVKVLHDLTFDARMLSEQGISLGNVRDTSVCARLLGFAATGLSALLDTELGIKLDKQFQRHDWSRRPMQPELLQYLAGDVVHLLELAERLFNKAARLGIEAEIADECAYKLWTAENPPRDTRPAYVRIKGAASLDPAQRAVLRRLVAARDVIAEAGDVPPFKVAANDTLLALARLCPRRAEDLACGQAWAQRGLLTHAQRWLDAIAMGLADADVPEPDRRHLEPVRPDRAAVARRRAVEGRISAWRRREARLRAVDEQVVLPGHCAHDLAEILVATPARDPSLPRRIASIPGIGERRLARYAHLLAALAGEDNPDAAAPKSFTPALGPVTGSDGHEA